MWRLCDEASGVALAELLGGSATVTLQADGSVKVAVGLPPGAQIKGTAGGGAAAAEQAAAAAAQQEQPAGADLYSEFT